MTVLEAIQRSADFLAKKEVESPRLQSELLLAHVLNEPRLQLYLEHDRPLAAAQIDALRALVQRRGKREPLQHLVGTVSFCGFELEVGPEALIPRPETEELVEQAWNWLETLGPGGEPRWALDFGTGTGCIAIALASRFERLRLAAVDRSRGALRLAARNCDRHSVGDRICLVETDALSALRAEPRFCLLISNPPYIPSDELPRLQPEVRRDPSVALDGGADGLDFYRRLSREGRACLRGGGRVMLEFGDGQSGPVAELFESNGWSGIEVKPDSSGRPRILIAERPEN